MAFALEPPARPLPRAGELWRGYSLHFLANGIVAFLFAATGPVAIILAVGAAGGLDATDLASWLFGGFAIGGAITILFSLIYRQPLGFAWSIPGTVLVGPALGHLSYPEVIGAFLATGLLMTVLGLTGLMGRAIAATPMPIVMGMVAGIFLGFGLDVIAAVADAFWIAVPMIVAFVAVSSLPTLARAVPPVLAALAAGVIALGFTGGFSLAAPAPDIFRLPNIYIPAFSWQAMAELVVPLAITVLAVHNAQGIAILRAAGHAPPVNAMTLACGIGSFFFAMVGAVNTCVTGPVNAILNTSGALERRYLAGLTFGAIAIAFGVFAPLATWLALGLPAAFVATLGGLALLRVLQAAFVTAFAGKFTIGAMVTFLVTVADVTIANIGAPFWGLVFGLAASWLLERKDFA